MKIHIPTAVQQKSLKQAFPPASFAYEGIKISQFKLLLMYEINLLWQQGRK